MHQCKTHSLLTTPVMIDLRAEFERVNRNPAHEAQDMSAEMKPVLEGITVLADDVPTLANFYRQALGMEPTVEEAHYVAFSGNALRFAIFSRAGMRPHTNDHPDYRRPFSGQAFELNFQCADADEVSARFAHICAYGGTVVASPKQMAWGHFTGFFADPEGNIHSLFADLSRVEI